MTYYDDNYTDYTDYTDYTNYDESYHDESYDSFQINALIAKKNEAELVSLMIVGFFIMFNILLYKSINKIISAQRERLVKYQLISEYYMNQSGSPLTCPIQTSKYIEDPDAILKHILKNETNETEANETEVNEYNNSEDITDSEAVLQTQKKQKTLDIKGKGWKLE